MHSPDPASHGKRTSHQPCETGPPSICSHASCQVQRRIRLENGDYYRDRDQSIVVGCRNWGHAIHWLTLCKDERLCCRRSSAQDVGYYSKTSAHERIASN